MASVFNRGQLDMITFLASIVYRLSWPEVNETSETAPREWCLCGELHTGAQ